jgi:peptidoglycan/LPS O-acetylase OafA/YrhL
MSLVIEERKYKTLDGLRGVAALAVLLWHVKPDIADSQIFSSGYLAVDIFFVLSGFVLAHAYCAKLLSGMSPGAFLVRRLIRLYPLYIAAGVLSCLELAASYYSHGGSRAQFVVFAANLLFVPLPFGQLHHFYPLNVPAWSLGMELVANVGFAALVFRLRNAVFLASIVAAGAIGVLVSAVIAGDLSGGAYWSDAPVGLARVVYSFFAGVALQRFHEKFPIQLPALAAYGCLFMLMLALWFAPSEGARAIYDLVMVLLVFPLLVLVGAACEPGRAGQAWMGIIGASSYAVYVLQTPLRQLALWVMSLFHLAPSLLNAIAYAASVFVIALIADAFYDIPIRRFLGALWSRQKGKTLASVASAQPSD